jgi:hypothetical protein
LPVIVAPVLLAWTSGLAAFPFCFSADGNNRQYSTYYPAYSRPDFWPGDYPPVPYPLPVYPVEVMPIVVQEEEAPALPAAIPAQHIFR